MPYIDEKNLDKLPKVVLSNKLLKTCHHKNCEGRGCPQNRKCGDCSSK